MKNHNLFLETYARIEDEKERLGFLRGYLFALSPKEMTDFMLANFDSGFLAYEQVFTAGSEHAKREAKKELEQAFNLLHERSKSPATRQL